MLQTEDKYFWGYRVTPMGEVFSPSGRRQKEYLRWGYPSVSLRSPFGVHTLILVHRLVAQLFVHNPAPSIFRIVDHIDGTMTNSIYNLRWVNHHLNCINKTKAKGCYYNKRFKKWQAKCCGKSVGWFVHEADAMAAYRKFRQQHFDDEYKRYVRDAQKISETDDSADIQTVLFTLPR